MIALDASVVVKWFKPHERFEAEAQSLLDLIGSFKVEALASEWLSLEVVRGLKRAQKEVPALAISDEDIHAAYEAIETLFRSGALLEVPVSEVKTLTKNVEIALGLYAADALHLATAIYLGARWLVLLCYFYGQYMVVPDRACPVVGGSLRSDLSRPARQ